MPIVQVNVIKGAFSREQKQDVIEGITDTFGRIKGDRFRDLVVVVLHEVDSGDVGKGGQPITLEKVREIAAAT